MKRSYFRQDTLLGTMGIQGWITTVLSLYTQNAPDLQQVTKTCACIHDFVFED